MNKNMLLVAACMISHGIMAQVSLDITVDNKSQTVLLSKNEQHQCDFKEASVAVYNKEETENSVLLEVAVYKCCTITIQDTLVTFGKQVSVAGIKIFAKLNEEASLATKCKEKAVECASACKDAVVTFGTKCKDTAVTVGTTCKTAATACKDAVASRLS